LSIIPTWLPIYICSENPQVPEKSSELTKIFCGGRSLGYNS
jgi:hypothetical protein